MPVQMLLHGLEGLFDVAIPLQQLTHKDAHLILEVLRGSPLLLDYVRATLPYCSQCDSASYLARLVPLVTSGRLIPDC